MKHGVYPLDQLPQETQDRVNDLASRPEKPPRWLKLGAVQLPSRAWYEWHWRRGLNPNGGGGLQGTLRRQVIERDGFVCGLCLEPVEADDIHIDHIRPRSLGGGDDLANLQVAHRACNLRKGNRV